MSRVEPIRSMEDIRRILRMLAADETPIGRRRFLLFVVGINTGLRISDIVRLRVGDIRGGSIWITEKKTGKRQDLPVSDELYRIVQKRCQGLPDDAWLFPARQQKSRRRMPVDAPGSQAARRKRELYDAQPEGPRHITTRTAYNDVRAIGKAAGLTEHVGCHTLRKTFGYQSYQADHDVAFLQGWYQHIHSDVTLRYIGITADQKRRNVNRISARLMGGL